MQTNYLWFVYKYYQKLFSNKSNVQAEFGIKLFPIVDILKNINQQPEQK